MWSSEKRKTLFGIILCICTIVVFSKFLFAQDTTQVISDSSEISYSFDDVEIGEVELIEITIEAEIEKPRVAILPKRVDPELGEMEFIDRSFENELKQGPEKPFLIEEQIRTPVKVLKKKIIK